MSNHDISEMVLGVIGFMVGFAVGCITMLRNCQKYPDRYQIRGGTMRDSKTCKHYNKWRAV